MRYIDAFNHFSPKRYFDALVESPAGQKDIGKRVRGIPALYDLELRLKVVDQFPDYTQVLSLGLPMVDRLWGPDKSPEMCKIANDGLAEVCAKHPDRFVGYSAVVPMNAPEEAAEEAERALKNGANAVQLGTNVNGKPIDGKEFWPLYEAIEKFGKPILLHPARSREMIDYQGEAKSKYEICSVLGWPFETGVCLSRFIFSKIMDTYPKLKIVSHHLGGVIPYLEGRIGHSFDQMGARTSDEDYEALRKSLKKRPFDYFKDFYADTAIEGVRGPMVCGIDFFGADHVLFASDCPFDKEKGPGYIRSTITVLEGLDLKPADREKISYKNAQAMFGVSSFPGLRSAVSHACALAMARGTAMLFANDAKNTQGEKTMSRRFLTSAVLGAALGALTCGAAQAQSFPARPITLVVPFPAGGTADLLCRFAGEKMSADLGQQVVIENRVGGAGGRVAIEQVLRAPPDGYTILCNTQLSYSITHLVFAKSSFDPRPLEPISVLATYPLVILVKASLPVSNLAEFNAYAKGGKVNYGNQGIANTGHLLGALMELKGGYKMTPVFYRGSAPAINDLLAGTIDMVPDYVLANKGNIDAGKIKMIAVADDHRLKEYPNVATMAETMPGVTSITWMAVSAPPGTPKEITKKLSDSIGKGFKEPSMHARILKLEANPLGNSPDEMRKMIKESEDIWGPVVKAAKISID